MANTGGRTRFFGLGLFAGLVAGLIAGLVAELGSAPAFAQDATNPASQETEVEAVDSAAPRVFTDPATGYVIAVPVGAELLRRGDNDRAIAIRSKRGFVVNVQSGPVNPLSSLNHMAGKLEAEYLGPGRQWTRKLGERTITVAGLPAYDAVYDGSGVRIRVLIVRGAVNDFVFMFFAPPAAYVELTSELEWVLASFRPSAADLALAGQPANVQPAPTGPGGQWEARRITDAGLGISQEIPVAWIEERLGPGAIVFSGPSGTESYFATVTVQAEAPQGTATLQAMVDRYRRDLADQAPDLRVVREGIREMRSGAGRVAGTEMELVYSHNGVETRKWVVILPRPAAPGTGATATAPGFHVWSYTAPSNLYDRYHPLAARIWATFSQLAG